MPKEILLNLGAGKGDGFRGSREGFQESSYWCQHYGHKGYGKPAHKCEECNPVILDCLNCNTDFKEGDGFNSYTCSEKCSNEFIAQLGHEQEALHEEWSLSAKERGLHDL